MDNKVFANFETSLARRDLDLMRHAQGKDRAASWDRQPPIKLTVIGVLICTYKPDFFVRYADGRKELVEVKGYWTREAKLKRKLFEATWLLTIRTFATL